jgi:phosphatidate cytidylyltransferase
MVGGVLAAMIVMMIYAVILQLGFKLQVNYLYALVYGFVCSLGGVFGDLCFSVIKRQTGIKDYGNLIPGHGGILDRFDSMMIVGPLVEVLLLLLPVAVR